VGVTMFSLKCDTAVSRNVISLKLEVLLGALWISRIVKVCRTSA